MMRATSLSESLPAEVERSLRQAVEFAFTAGVEASEPAGEVGARDGTPPVEDSVQHLADMLYSMWYAGWSVPAGPLEEKGRTREVGAAIVEALRAAHAGSTRFEDGWVALQVWPTGRILVSRDEERRVLDPLDYVSVDRPGLSPRPGTRVRVVSRHDSVLVQPGYWITYGPQWERRSRATELLRLYWNVGPASAPILVRELTGRLATTGVPYALKLPSDAYGYSRTDAAVLFVPAHVFSSLVPELRRAHAVLAGSLRPDAPPLTRKLEAGLALAEDPGPGESFGSSRCRLIAEALVPAINSKADRDALLGAVIQRFAMAGLNPSRPYLNAPGNQDYKW